METPVDIAEGIPFLVAGDIDEMDRMELRRIEFDVLECQIMGVNQTDSALQAGIEPVISFLPVDKTENLGGNIAGFGEHFQPLHVLFFILGEDIEAGPRVVQPRGEPGKLQPPQEDEAVGPEFFFQGFFFPPAEQERQDIAEGNLFMEAFLVRKIDQDQIALVFVAGFFQDRTGERLGLWIDSEENMVLPVISRVAGVGTQPDPVAETSRKDLEYHHEAETKDQGKDRQIAQQQTRQMEDNGRVDIIEDKSFSDEHFESGDQRYQSQLDPVAVRNRMR